MKKRILSLFLALALMLTLLPAVATIAGAAEYSSGTTLNHTSLANGDTIRKGVVIRNTSVTTVVIHKVDSPTSISSITKIGSIRKGTNWTADTNYYVFLVDGFILYLYPITETSAITFYPSGGTIQGGTAAKTFTATKYLSDYCDVSWLTPSRPGCTFLGWYTSDGKEQVYNANGIAVNGTYWKNNLWQGQGAKSLIAKWQANTSVTFRYFPNGGTGQPDNYVQWTANATYFDTYDSDSHWNYTSGQFKLTRTGYTATGYFAKKDGSCVVHEDEVFTSYPQLCAAYGLNPDTCGNATIDIYAQWSPNNYTVSFDSGGGSVDTGSKSVTYDSTYGDLPTPTRDSHTFNGWFTAAEGGTQVTNATKVTTASNHTLYAQWTKASYTVTWKNYDGTVLETDNRLTYGTTPEYNGDTPIKPEDEEFTYTFSGWSPEPSPVTGNAEYTAQFTANSKRVEPTYTVTIPATAKVGEEITISATDVVLNEDETLTVTLQSDFKLYMGQNVALPFVINGGSIQNNAVILSITGNGDQTAPQTAESIPLTVTPAEDPPYAGTYTGTIHFTIAVTTAGNN